MERDRFLLGILMPVQADSLRIGNGLLKPAPLQPKLPISVG